MRRSIRYAMLSLIVLVAGCTTFRAYPGEPRSRAEVATLAVPPSVITVDGQPIDREDVSAIELLPGDHHIEWDFTYPNGFTQRKQLGFSAFAGKSYRLNQRFFATPHRYGAIGATIDLALDTALTPATIVFPAEASSGPPDGEYYSWVMENGPLPLLVAGQPPDLPLAHAPLTFVPVGDDEAP